MMWTLSIPQFYFQRDIMFEALLTVGLAALASAAGSELDYIGPCKEGVQSAAFDIDQFANENGGVWNFVKIPNTPALSTVSNLELIVRKEEEGKYKSVITTELGQGRKRFISEEEIENNGNGILKARTREGTEFRVYFMKYKPNKFAYYYICGDRGGDNDVDYRYVLSHGPLSDEDSAEINRLEERYNFKGDLKNLEVQQTLETYTVIQT